MNCLTKTLFTAAFLLGLFSSTAYAQGTAPPASRRLSDYVNDDLPSWFRFSGEYRVRVEGIDSAAFRPANNDAFVLSRVRINTTFIPASWMRLQLQGQDAQVMARNAKPDAPPFEDTFDLRQAYVEFGNPDANTFALRAGRQELVFGEQRLVGHVSWLNAARSFDAVRATYRNAHVRVDAFAASVVNVREGEFNKRADANNFHGAYVVLPTAIPRASVEPYVFWRVARGMRAEDGSVGKMDFKTVGFRFAGRVPAGLDYSFELAGQTGELATDDVKAWAGHWVLGHTMPVKYTPRLSAEYNYASGDANPTDGIRQGFDQLYPTPHDKYGLADQVGWKNIHNVRSGIELKPTPKLTLSSSYHSWWLASTRDGLYNAGGALVARVADGSGGKHVGQELDIQAVYPLTPQVQFSGGYAHIFPGTFLKRATPGESYRSTFVMVNYLF